MRDPDQEPSHKQERYQKLDPRTQDEVGGILERAFRREQGRETLEDERLKRQALAQEAEQKAENAEQLASEAEDASRRASERYALTHSQDDLDAVQRWEAEAAGYQREAEAEREEAERLRKFFYG